MRRSIAELCVADHRNDEAILSRWLGNKTPEVFYRANGYVEDGLPVGNFGTSSGYPMTKRLAHIS